MDLRTISQVTRDYGVSPRMLRYYEQAGLIQSKRKDDYAYRVYDEDSLTRLRQIIVLRKLRVPVKQIIGTWVFTLLTHPQWVVLGHG